MRPKFSCGVPRNAHDRGKLNAISTTHLYVINTAVEEEAARFCSDQWGLVMQSERRVPKGDVSMRSLGNEKTYWRV